nr:hypothetical protein [Clostridioides sp.]
MAIDLRNRAYKVMFKKGYRDSLSTYEATPITWLRDMGVDQDNPYVKKTYDIENKRIITEFISKEEYEEMKNNK